MPLFAIRRPVPGASDADIDAAAFRAINCLPWHEGMRWVRSFHDREREELTCYYEARSAEDIRVHSDRAALPCAEVREVREILPDPYVHA